MIDVQTRLDELMKTHDQLVAQLQQVSTQLERVRGAIALCHELLAAATQNGASADPPADAEQKADTYA